MGFRAGAQRIFGTSTAPKPIELGEAAAIGKLHQQVQQDKITNENNTATLNLQAAERVSQLFKDAPKMNPQQRKMLSKSISKISNSVFGFNYTPDLIETVLGDEEQSAAVAGGFQELLQTAGTPGETETLQRLKRAGASPEQLTDFIKFSAQQKQAAIRSEALAQKDTTAQRLRADRERFTRTTTLRNTFNTENKNLISVLPEFEKLAGILENPQGFKDQLGIDFFNKLSNPNIGVRQGDVVKTLATGSLTDRALAGIQSIFSDKKFIDDQRTGMVAAALGTTRVMKDQLESAITETQRRAAKEGVDPADAVPDKVLRDLDVLDQLIPTLEQLFEEDTAENNKIRGRSAQRALEERKQPTRPAAPAAPQTRTQQRTPPPKAERKVGKSGKLKLRTDEIKQLRNAIKALPSLERKRKAIKALQESKFELPKGIEALGRGTIGPQR